MAGDNSFGEEGTIGIAKDVGFTDETLAGILNIPVKLWRTVKGRLVNHPEPNETRLELYPLGQGYGLRVLNWSRYQSEYSRQRPYRSDPPLDPPLKEEEDSERRRERGDSEGEVTQVTEKVTEKVTDSLPPIPGQASLKAKDKMKEIRHLLNDKRRKMGDPDYLRRHQFSIEDLQGDVNRMTQEYIDLVNDYAD
jgi:hypothetical protein